MRKRQHFLSSLCIGKNEIGIEEWLKNNISAEVCNEYYKRIEARKKLGWNILRKHKFLH